MQPSFKPIIKKKPAVIPPTMSAVSVNVKPGMVQVIRQPQRPQPQRMPIQQVQVQAPPPPASQPLSKAVSSRKELLKRTVKRQKTVQYLQLAASLDSLPRMQRLRDIGRGRSLIIIANGPSILEVELGKLRNQPNIDTLSINRPDERIWPTTYWSFFDQSQLTRNIDLWNGYQGIIFNSTSIKKQNEKSIQFMNIHEGFSLDLTKGLQIGRSSVYASMQIALWMNYDRVFIFGCDMCRVNDKLHFYGTNPDVKPDIRVDRFKGEAEFYDRAAAVLGDDAKRFYFCSSYNKWPFVDKYSQLDHTTAVEFILNQDT